jgi:hypothetical protein
MDIPAAGWVSEGGVKPVGNGAVGIKTMVGKKVALLVPVSQEIAMTNAAGLYTQLRQDLPTAIARAFDYAAIHGLDLRTGGRPVRRLPQEGRHLGRARHHRAGQRRHVRRPGDG